MDLYIHGGLNKTGTSYLQVLLERNADFLRSQGISYSHSLAGAGNAAQFLSDVRRGDIGRLRARLNAYRETAESTGANRLLLSSEIFYHDIVNSAHRETLLQEFRAAGFNKPNLLLFFRDPAAHAVSCFCHRSGTRNTGGFEDWLRTSYEFPSELRQLREAVNGNLGMLLSLRPYSADGLSVELTKWLSSPPLPTTISETINKSVNVCEAELLSSIYPDNPNAALKLREFFKVLNPHLKASDVALRTHLLNIANDFLQDIHNDLDWLEAEIGEPISQTDSQTEILRQIPEGICLSRAQFEAMSAAFRPLPWTTRSIKRIRVWLRALRPRVAAKIPK